MKSLLPFLTVAMFSLFCLLFGTLRYFVLGDVWGFLNHNLWLAWIPAIFAALARLRCLPNWGRAVLGLAWLAFLPNAPYIVTDLIHLTGKSALPWFDLLILFNYAVAGLLAGCLSLDWMRDALARTWGNRVAWAICLFAIAASGLGMVMGRDLRLDSEELFTRPLTVVLSTLGHLDLVQSFKAGVYAATFGSFYFMYLSLGRGRSSFQLTRSPEGVL